MPKIDNDTNCLYYLQQDNTSALEYLIRIYFPILCTYYERITDNKADAEDVTEEVFVKIWGRRNSFKDFGELKAFLYTSVRNASLNVVRRRQREKLRHEDFVKSENKTGFEEYMYEEMLAEIRKSMETLPRKMREIFILSYYKKMSNSEIAEHLNLSQQTVRNQKSKAVAMLRALLKDRPFALIFIFFCL